MDSGLGESREETSPRAAEPDLRLLTELTPWYQIFFENVRDTLLRREPGRVWTTSPPGRFWPDVFVPTGIPWARMGESASLHVLAIAMLVSFTNLYFMLHRRTVQLRPHTSILHYQLSEYLPPINTGSPPAPTPREGHPLLAKQKIISLPPTPDNFEQTIVSPIDVKLPTNVPLPNIVAWTDVPAPPSADALRNNEQLKMPDLARNVLPPPPQAEELDRRAVPDFARNVIGPAPGEAQVSPDRKFDFASNVIGPPPADDTAKLRAPRDIIAIKPAVIAPPPDATLSSNIGAMNIARLTATVPAPKIEVAEQHVMQLPQGKSSLSGSGGGASGSSAAPPPPPVTQGGLNNGPLAGQLIALSLHPAVPTGPLNVPPGRRSGEFAAGPEGKPDAPGTPEVKGGGQGAGGSGTGSAGPGKSGNSNLPPGIIIGAAPNSPPPGSVVVAGKPQPASLPKDNSTDKQVLTASARPPRVGETPDTSVGTSAPTTSHRLEDRIFSGKKSYSMALNSPNLSSAGGSWIIHFAELDNDKTAGEITAPIATTTVDPAYPAELMRQGVEGTVVLYAVIRKDGTVADVRVLRGLQGRLDENARTALLRWKFRPGTKNGQAVDLEAVVQIPYKAPNLNY